MARTSSRKRGAAKPADKTGQTADRDDVARFSALADQWWNTDGPFQPLHRLNPVRIGYVRDRLAGFAGHDPLADRPLRGLSILDIGCGGGLLAEPLTRLGANVTGIDASAENIGAARAHAEAVGLAIDYRCILPEVLAATGKRFDAVVALEVIEHVADVDAFLAACAALTKPNGAVVMATLNRTLKSLALAKIGAEYILGWVPAGTHDWRKFLRPSELTAGLARAGIEVTDLTGMIFSPLTGEWTLGRDLDVNYLAFGVTAR
jgi:2-polyprenyl-6-hydroxyphenyl methylase/3-demethylubiquinone-9 3-methyltransferase